MRTLLELLLDQETTLIFDSCDQFLYDCTMCMFCVKLRIILFCSCDLLFMVKPVKLKLGSVVIFIYVGLKLCQNISISYPSLYFIEM